MGCFFLEFVSVILVGELHLLHLPFTVLIINSHTFIMLNFIVCYFITQLIHTCIMCGMCSGSVVVCVVCKTTGLKVKSVFRRTAHSYGPQCDEVSFYHDDSAADKQWLSNMM